MCNSTVQSFPAQTKSNLHTLILGSMPGIASLNEDQYYAHPRNAFWPIMLSYLFKQEVSFELITQYSYPQRINAALASGFGLWDVLAQCDRPGSLDSAIVTATETSNDIGELAKNHLLLKHIIFNGKAAEKYFMKHQMNAVQDYLQQTDRRIAFSALPSTSPAMTSLTLTQKATLWHEKLGQWATPDTHV